MKAASMFLACCIGKASFKFLGIPVGANPRRYHTWELVIKAMKQKLSSWKSKQLSIGGRITLINAVLSSMPLYFFSFNNAPKKVIHEVIRIQRQFMWGGNDRKLAWVKWGTICMPKEKGGLGIKNLQQYSTLLY